MAHLHTQKGFSAAAMVLTAAVLFLAGSLALATNSWLKQKTGKNIVDLGALSNIDTGLKDADNAPLKDPVVPTAADYEVLNESDFLRLDDKYDSSTKATSAPLTEGELFALAPSIILEDQAGSGAIGKAALAVYEGTTYLRAAAINLPPPPAGSDYYAWLSRDIAKDEVIAAGALAYEASSSQARLSYAHPGDASSYRRITITVGQAGSGIDTNRVLEGTIPDEALPYVTREDINRSRETAGTPPLPEPTGTNGTNTPIETKKSTTTSTTSAGSGIGSMGDELILKLLAGQTSPAGDTADYDEELKSLLEQSGFSGSVSDQELMERLFGK